MYQQHLQGALERAEMCIPGMRAQIRLVETSRQVAYLGAVQPADRAVGPPISPSTHSEGTDGQTEPLGHRHDESVDPALHKLN